MNLLPNRDVTLGLVRHVLTIAGGSLVTKGTMTAAQWESLLGALLTLAGIAWSVLDKRQRRAPTG